MLAIASALFALIEQLGGDKILRFLFQPTNAPLAFAVANDSVSDGLKLPV